MKRYILWFLAVFTIIVLLLMALAPMLSKNYLNKNGEKLLGRKIHIEKLKLNYFTSTLRVNNFKMYEENEGDVFIRFDSLLVNVKPLRLLKKEIHVQQFHIVNSHAQILQNDTFYNFSDIVEFFDTGDPEIITAVEDEKKSYRLNLNNFEVRRGGIRYHDLILDHDMALQDISFLIPNIYWGVQEKSKADVNFKLGRGGRFSSSFDYDTETGDFDGVVELSGLDLEVVLPYLQEYIDFSDIDGVLSSIITFSGNEYKLDELNIKGMTSIDNMAIKDANDRTVLGIKSGLAVIKEFKPLQYFAEIDTLLLTEPYSYFALIDSTSNFEKMLLLETEEQKEDAGSVDEDISKQVYVNNFVIKNGLVDFSDQRLYEEFNYELSKVTVDMDTIHLQDEWINITANMKLNKRGNLDAKIGMNPFNPENRIKIEYVISDFQLPDLNIYSKHYTGLPILFGDMYYLGNTSIENGQLESHNELVIRNVEMGRKTGGLYDIPLKLALFILKDANGDILLDIPVTGDVSDPKTNVGAIVWDTFKGFMGKIATSPFRALGNLLGADPKDIEEIPMNYGDTILSGKQEKSLDYLLELEKMKPELQITLQYYNDKKLERTDIATVLVNDAFYEKYNKRAKFNKKDYLEYLAETSGRDSMLIQDYERLLAPEEKIDSVLQVREDLRVNLLKEYLLSQIDSTSIRVNTYNDDEVLNHGSRPLFKITYTLAEDEEPRVLIQ